MNMPSQICNLTEMVHFSSEAYNAIKKNKVPNYRVDLQKRLETFTSFDFRG